MNIGLLVVDREKAKRGAYKKLCYNFEYKFGSNICQPYRLLLTEPN